MRYRFPLVMLVWTAAAGAPPGHAIEAQAPRVLRPALPRAREAQAFRDTSVANAQRAATVRRIPDAPQEPESRQGINVGWTVLGAVLGYVYYQSSTADLGDGDFAGPLNVAICVGLGAALGTLVGMILD